MFIPIEERRNAILRYDVSFPTRWEMRMNLPLGSQNNDFFLSQIDERILNSDRRLSLSCEQCDIPGRLFSTTEHKIYSIDRKIPYGTIMEDVQMTFRCSEDLFERKFFEAWHSLIQNPITKNYGYYSDYTVDIEIFQYDASLREVVHGIRLIEAYPFSIFPISLNSEGGSITNQSVAFKYKEWISMNVRDDINNISGEAVSSFPSFLDNLVGRASGTFRGITNNIFRI